MKIITLITVLVLLLLGDSGPVLVDATDFALSKNKPTQGNCGRAVPR